MMKKLLLENFLKALIIESEDRKDGNRMNKNLTLILVIIAAIVAFGALGVYIHHSATGMM